MSSDNPADSTCRQPRGRPFLPGNPGRKRGSRNKITAIAQAMFRDDAPEIMRIAIDMAKCGNERMIKLFVDRMLPKHLVEMKVPSITFASDAVDAVRAILDEVAAGKISPSEGAAVASIIETCARIINVADTEFRLALIEQKLKDSEQDSEV
jgi:hypothetical protein